MALLEDERRIGPSDEYITTTEAATLTDRTPGAIRQHVKGGKLRYEGFNEDRRPLLSRAKVLEWYATHPPQPRPPRNTWLETLAALRLLGSATPAELADYLGLHPGNVLKHLRIMDGRGEAARLSDGQWAATDDIAQGRVRQDDNGAWYPALTEEEIDEPAVERIEPSRADERVGFSRGAA